jgi:hypothetical protein
MATILLDIPDRLITLYNQARASWNAYAPTVGQLPLATPSKAIVENRLKTQLKTWVVGEAIRTGMDDAALQALVVELGTL